MRLRLFKPAQGWSGFFTELAIVVLGVLIALGAQQAVDAWQARRDVADFRAAIDVELADNLQAYQGRMIQGECLARKLDQLADWQRDWRDGDGPALDGEIGRPLAFGLYFTVWRTGAASIAARMALKERLAYAGFYAALEGYDALRYREVEAWQGLYAYDGAARLSPPEVNALRGLILSARSVDRSMRLNWPGIQAAAVALGIRLPATNAPFPDNGLCKPLKLRTAA